MSARPEDIEAVRSWLRRSGASFLNPRGLLERIRAATGVPSVLTVSKCLQEMQRLGEVSCDTWMRHEPLARLHIHLAEAPLAPAEAAWRASVDAKPELGDEERVTYHALWSAIEDWPVETHAALIAEIEALRRADHSRPSYLLSASGRLASSKLLSALPKAALKKLGIDMDAIDPGPLCFLIAGAAAPDAVVLVENPNAFERALTATADLPLCWVSAHGFGASALEAGQRLADGIERPARVVTAVRSGAPPALVDLLTHPNLFYWGDLDTSGLHIFHRVRTRLPAIRLSALMGPMIDLLRSGGGHPYTWAVGKTGQRTWTSGNEDLDALLTLCASSAADQEHVAEADIRQLGGLPLETSATDGKGCDVTSLVP